jgi:hypothetical protein
MTVFMIMSKGYFILFSQRRELNGHSSNRPVAPSNTTKETVMDQQSTAV